MTPIVLGKMVYVSADAMPNVNNPTYNNIYIARIDPGKTRRRISCDVGNTSGGLRQTGQRTFFKYPMKPVKDTMSCAFRHTWAAVTVSGPRRRRARASLVKALRIGRV